MIDIGCEICYACLILCTFEVVTQTNFLDNENIMWYSAENVGIFTARPDHVITLHVEINIFDGVVHTTKNLLPNISVCMEILN